jgi:hypothetical protein
MKAWFVTKRLAFGSAITTWGHVEKLQGQGITHIINLRHNKHGKKIRQFKNLWLPFKDNDKPRPAWLYRRALHFYQKAMRKPKSKLLCMCHHGKCRSASLAYFLLRVDGLSIARAKSTILKARRSARIIPAYYRSSEDFLSLYKVHQFIKGKRSKS